MKKPTVAVVATLAFFYLAANGQTITYGLQGSSFIAQGTNPTEQGKNCNIAYTISYSQFGTPGQQAFNRAFGMPPHFNGVVVNHPTTWDYTTMSLSNVSWSCT
ncbi:MULTISPECIES: hypothetical protein [Paraburkholderia]|uniref:hypothetical protein n=1 Tax=Paraburkholderia TaxID=1822464 RepID=UPI003218CF93